MNRGKPVLAIIATAMLVAGSYFAGSEFGYKKGAFHTECLRTLADVRTRIRLLMDARVRNLSDKTFNSICEMGLQRNLSSLSEVEEHSLPAYFDYREVLSFAKKYRELYPFDENVMRDMFPVSQLTSNDLVRIKLCLQRTKYTDEKRLDEWFQGTNLIERWTIKPYQY